MRAPEISALVGAVVAGEGAELIELEVGGSSRRPLLRAYVDVPGGTSVEACAELSRKIEARLDASGLAGERYTLEVSSPGLDRPLRSRRDFERLLGKTVAVWRRDAGEGGSELVGTVEEVGGEGEGHFWLVLRPEGSAEPRRLDAGEITSAKPHLRW